jgi:uncharacterized membrane protein
MTAVELAERKSRWRAFGFLFLAALTLAVIIVVRRDPANDFMQGLWFGLLFGCAVSLMPIHRWLRPNSAVFRLLDDEGARENRRVSCTVGFWAAITMSLLFVLLGRADPTITANAVGQIVATAGVMSAIIAFAILELRGTR